MRKRKLPNNSIECQPLLPGMLVPSFIPCGEWRNATGLPYACLWCTFTSESRQQLRSHVCAGMVPERQLSWPEFDQVIDAQLRQRA